MTYTKSFPVLVKRPVYTKWEEVCLSEDEEFKQEERVRKKNIVKMKQCIEDSKQVLYDMGLKQFTSAVADVAVALFNKTASSPSSLKTDLCRQKFDQSEICRFTEKKKV